MMDLYHAHPTLTIVLLVVCGLAFLIPTFALAIFSFMPSPYLNKLYAEWIEKRKQA